MEVPPQGVWLKFRNTLPWLLERSKLSDINNVSVWKYLSLKLDMRAFNLQADNANVQILAQYVWRQQS